MEGNEIVNASTARRLADQSPYVPALGGDVFKQVAEDIQRAARAGRYYVEMTLDEAEVPKFKPLFEKLARLGYGVFITKPEPFIEGRALATIKWED